MVDNKGRGKKFLIALGSFMGIMATAIGFIAVFFPDLFNMQKDRIVEFNLEVEGPEDADKLEEFLFANPEKIVRLNIRFCAGLENRCPSIDFTNGQIIFQVSNPKDPCRPVAEFGGTTFDLSPVWKRRIEIDAGCRLEPDSGMWVAEGYFLIPRTPEYHQGTFWFFESVPEMDVRLKNY